MIEIELASTSCEICGHTLLIPRHAETDPDTGDLEAQCSVHGLDHGTQWAPAPQLV